MEASFGVEQDQDLKYPEWQKPYLDALVEPDHAKLQERIAAAKTAISNRLHAISASSDHHAERQAMEDALASLRVLKREKLS
jgi:hypothetical protein